MKIRPLCRKELRRVTPNIGYFIQRKGFLDGEVNYLRDRLRKVQLQRGRGKLLTFYRYFLIVLFHEGFRQGTREQVLRGRT